MFRLLSVVAVLLALNVRADSGANHQIAQGRPIQLGTSGGNLNDSSSRYCCSGTLGAVVKDSSGKLYILSNNHVLSLANLGHTGDAITQPGLVDANCRLSTSDSVANLTRFVTLQFAPKQGAAPPNKVDAAIAQIITGDVNTTGAIIDIGSPSSSTVAPSVGMNVKKSGRTTGLTKGKIASVNVTINVGYGTTCGGRASQVAQFVNQIRITGTGGNFSAGGDSGSLIVEDVASCPRAVGLLFAGGSTDTFGNTIGDVLSGLNVSMAGCGGAAAATLVDAFAPGSFEIAHNAHGKAQSALHKIAGVVGSGIGRHEHDASLPVIEIYVEKDSAEVRRNLPRTIDGVPVTVIETGKIMAY